MNTVKIHITGTRRGLGKRLQSHLPFRQYDSADSIEECDVFINCKHNHFEQVDLLYHAAKLNKRIINIGSNSPDTTKKMPHPYAIEKAALDEANDQLFYQGVDTTILRFGYFDSERVMAIDKPKMSLEYVAGMVWWVLAQPYRIKDLTVCP